MYRTAFFSSISKIGAKLWSYNKLEVTCLDFDKNI